MIFLAKYDIIIMITMIMQIRNAGGAWRINPKRAAESAQIPQTAAKTQRSFCGEDSTNAQRLCGAGFAIQIRGVGIGEKVGFVWL